MNNFQSHFLSVSKTANVITVGNPEKAKYFWMILHGYGQLSELFLENFFELTSQEEHFLVLPNALNNFYLRMGKEDVGASWMTKYNRENDIADNTEYLNIVYDTFIKAYLNENKQFIGLGFSQGAATLVRWAAQHHQKINQIILWGSVFPQDIQSEIYLQKIRNKKWYYVVGSNDEYVGQDKVKEQLKIFEQEQFNFEYMPYQGKHHIISSVLKEVVSKVKNTLPQNH